MCAKETALSYGDKTINHLNGSLRLTCLTPDDCKSLSHLLNILSLGDVLVANLDSGVAEVLEQVS